MTNTVTKEEKTVTHSVYTEKGCVVITEFYELVQGRWGLTKKEVHACTSQKVGVDE